jgi:hypothetical protein
VNNWCEYVRNRNSMWNINWTQSFMKNLQTIAIKEREHFMQCGICKDWFDMRNLNEVLSHEHKPCKVPYLLYSHVSKKGKDGEVYLPRHEGMLTVRIRHKKA